MSTLKLKALIENVGNEQPTKEWTTEEKRNALAAIAEYGECGKHLYREHSLMELAHRLSEIIGTAQELALHETNRAAVDGKGWFDENTVKRNFAQLEKISEEFNKLAKEAQTLQQRMEALYEDGAHVVGRYYEIKNLKEGVAVSKIAK